MATITVVMNFQAMEVIGALQRIAVLVCIQQYAYQILAHENIIASNMEFGHIVTSDIAEDCKGSPSTDWNCCSDAFPCMLGGGDCDDDSQCAGNLVCGSDNCRRDFSSSNSNWMTGADCCRGNLLYLVINRPITDCMP